jgi:hypothetical protein
VSPKEGTSGHPQQSRLAPDDETIKHMMNVLIVNMDAILQRHPVYVL